MNKHVFQVFAVMAVATVLSASVLPALAGSRELTLPHLIEYSLQHNGEIRAFRSEKGIHEANKIKAGVLSNSTLEFEGSSGALTGSSSESGLSLGVSQEILLAGKRGKRLAVADLELEIYRWQLAERERALRDEVKTAFYAALLAEQRAVLAERSIVLNRQLLDVSMARLTAGDIPELEVNLVRVELARAEGAHISVKQELDQSQAKLMDVIGAPLSERPAISGDLAESRQPSAALEDLKLLAQTNRPDLKVLQAENNRGDAHIDLAQAEGVPNLTAGVAVSRDTASKEIGGVEGRETDYTIGLKLSIPIPFFDRNQAGVHEARARKQGTERRLDAYSIKVEREVESAYAGVLNARSALDLYRERVLPQLDENLKLTQEAYRLGEVGVLAVIQEQKKFFEVNDSYLTAMYDNQMALVKLETAVAVDLIGGTR